MWILVLTVALGTIGGLLTCGVLLIGVHISEELGSRKNLRFRAEHDLGPAGFYESDVQKLLLTTDGLTNDDVDYLFDNFILAHVITKGNSVVQIKPEWLPVRREEVKEIQVSTKSVPVTGYPARKTVTITSAQVRVARLLIKMREDPDHPVKEPLEPAVYRIAATKLPWEKLMEDTDDGRNMDIVISPAQQEQVRRGLPL